MDNSLLMIMEKSFNQMSDIAILFEVIDRRFKFFIANKAAYEAGFKEEWYGKFVEDVLPPDFAAPINNILHQALVTGKAVRMEEGLPTTIGRFLGDIVITPIFSDNGQCTHILGIGRDITELKRREMELIRTKAFVESVLSSITDGILVTDINRNIIRINRGFSNLFVWKENDVAGLPLSHLNLIPPDYADDHQNIIKKLKQGKNIPSYQSKRRRKNGSLLSVSASYAPLKGDNGDIIGFIGIYRDISEQIEKERQMEESIQRYQSLVVHHPDAVFEFDLNGHFTGANHALEQVTGYTLDELLHHSFVPLITPDKLEPTINHFQAAAQGETRNYESAIYNKKGERIELDVTNVPIVVDGQITGVFGLAKNITEQKRLQNELIQTKETLESFFNNTTDAIDIIDLNKRITVINPAFESMFGYTEDEIIGKNLSMIIPEGKIELERLFKSVLDGRVVHGLETVRQRKDGSHIDVSLSLSPIRNEKGNITAVAAITRDISEKKRAERRIQESEEKYRLIAENMTDLIALISVENKILYASPSHQTVLGRIFKEGDVFPNELVHKEDLERVEKCFRNVFETQEQGWIEFRIQHGEGHFIWLDTKLIPVSDNNGELQHVLCISRDITERKQYQDVLEKMAYYDYLTGAANRRLFMERLQYTIIQANRDQESFAVMSLDFDHFKWVNDTLGHDVGDELLVQFVHRLRTCIRQIDTLARLGGDEFAILLPGISSFDDVERVAQRILEALQERWEIKGHAFITTCSIGISIFPRCGDDVSQIMKHADQALYKAKQCGRNNYSICGHTAELLQHDSNESFEEEIKRAIHNNEFYLVYQPKFHLSTKRIVSIEALIRWEHPKRGLIVPSEFISRAEELDLIVPITHWVLEQAAMQVKKWQALYHEKIPVAVNISASYFEKGKLVNDIAKITKKIGIDPQSFILEITESTMIRDMDKTVQTLRELKELGVKIAIDDFGTGFSSLSYLMKLHVDILKLDKTFIQELTSQKNASIVHSIVSLAHNLNLEVVAEGIETEKQCQLLNQYGCDIGQGYFFSKPLTGEQLERVFFHNG
jgi:diguanylate cyclase (GGDEF)-like protein/PAS domain S-box-containing protein